jgi:hypothetical protein
MNSPEHVEKKKLAALACALGWTRSVLSDAIDGDLSLEQARRVYEASAVRRIAESIGLTEADLVVDLDLLSEAEKHKIQGYDTA